MALTPTIRGVIINLLGEQMRIAVLIIALCLTMIVGLQSCAVMVGGSMIADDDLAGGGALGILLSLVFVLGAALAMGLPRVSMVLFGLAALIGFIAASTGFSDMAIWGGVSAVGPDEFLWISRTGKSQGGCAMNAYLEGMRRSFDFAGRSGRRAYWFYTLSYFVILLVLAIVDGAIGTLSTDGIGVLGGVAMLVHLIPAISVTVRRLHDIGRSGWWLLIGFIPLVGIITLIVFACMPSQPGANRFGDHTSTEPVSPAPAPAPGSSKHLRPWARP